MVFALFTEVNQCKSRFHVIFKIVTCLSAVFLATRACYIPVKAGLAFSHVPICEPKWRPREGCTGTGLEVYCSICPLEVTVLIKASPTMHTGIKRNLNSLWECCSELRAANVLASYSSVLATHTQQHTHCVCVSLSLAQRVSLLRSVCACLSAFKSCSGSIADSGHLH